MTEPTKNQHGWRDRLPSEQAWKPRQGMSQSARSAEQDRAAGGRHRRVVVLDSGERATGSIAFRVYRRTRRIRAYLRWSQQGQTRERYVGEVNAATRVANLAQAWAVAREAGLVTDEELPAGSEASSTAVRAVMAANKGRDTKPELLLRSILHGKGLRYRVNARPLPDLRRTADLVFTKARVAVFVDGCYWHGCPDHYRPAMKRSRFWKDKIEGNQARDADTNRRLREHGWTVVRVWEHEDPNRAAEKVRAALATRLLAPAGPEGGLAEQGADQGYD
ncbi:very short patch repair endonuclease [Streptomyces spinoverrucosus]|uniref:very short patch repair endonuclease n=1 Tax=Streptomyces spinoverrucosus TaxID=284043 RepID=UPI0018C3F23B|nr:very short patch repair endonuclease [Streptomyces spinoverrucosus]MBG0854957.1 very short patch repair endonuclease [Streptomyces spinoverrucosus]